MNRIWQREYKNIHELLLCLNKHRYWCKIDDEIRNKIFLQLYDNANNVNEATKIDEWKAAMEKKGIKRVVWDNHAMQTIRNFLLITDEYEVVKKNFINIIKNQKDNLGIDNLTMFAITLGRLGAKLSEGYPYNNKSDEELKDIMSMAELSYNSSILCDRFLFPSYYVVIFCCSAFLDLNSAIKRKEKFDLAVKDINSIKDSFLNSFQLQCKNGKDFIKEIQDSINKELNKIPILIKRKEKELGHTL